VPADQVPRPLAPEIANHVAAVTLFGTPSENFLNQYGAPQIAIGPLYQAKTIELCAPGDGICGDGDSPIAHISYPANGMVSQGADFAASHL
jgi:cutinase